MPTALATASLTLHRALVARDLDADALFKKAGFDTRLFLQQGARVRSDVTRRLWAVAVEASGDPCIGLDMWQHEHPSASYGLSYAWLASSTLERAMERLARYMRVISDIARMWTEREPDATRLALRAARGEAMLPPAMQDAFFAGVVAASRSTFGDHFAPLAVQFRHDRPPCANRFDTFFRCPVTFDHTESSMTVGNADLRAPLPTANADLALANDKVMQDYLSRIDRDDVVARVRRSILRRLPLGSLSDADLARELAMSPRTLQRRLAEHSTSFWRVLDDTRHELALERLRDHGTAISEVAYLLGFAETASFNRAFKRWMGRTPSEFRTTSPK